MFRVCYLIQATIYSLNKSYRLPTGKCSTNSDCICHSQNLSNEVISEWKGNIEKMYPLNMDFPAELVWWGILRIHLMISSPECNHCHIVAWASIRGNPVGRRMSYVTLQHQHNLGAVKASSLTSWAKGSKTVALCCRGANSWCNILFDAKEHGVSCKGASIISYGFKNPKKCPELSGWVILLTF